MTKPVLEHPTKDHQPDSDHGHDHGGWFGESTELYFAVGSGITWIAGIIKQNLWVSLGIVSILIPATILGWASIGIAVVIHEGSTLLVVANALRLLGYKSYSQVDRQFS